MKMLNGGFNDDYYSIYSVIAPSSIRPNSEYHVAVMVAEISTPVTMLLEIEGHLDNGERFNLTEIINTEPYATRIVNFNVSKNLSNLNIVPVHKYNV